jgi:hypothetical protein
VKGLKVKKFGCSGPGPEHPRPEVSGPESPWPLKIAIYELQLEWIGHFFYALKWLDGTAALSS